MNTVSPVRSAVDLMQVRALFTVLDRLFAFAPDLVVVRGSTAVFAHAPSLARIPNDLDVFWLGDADSIQAIIAGITARPGVRTGEIRLIPPPDKRISAFHRIDVTVWLTPTDRPSHRLWLDLGTSSRLPAKTHVTVPITKTLRTDAVVVELRELLAEKLWVYLESASHERPNLRWSDLFDMIVLIGATPDLLSYAPQDIDATAVRYFARRGGRLPRVFPPPPREWRSAWYRLVGPVARRAPTLHAAWSTMTAFWGPVLAGGMGTRRLRWHPDQWSWQPGDSCGTLNWSGD
jgi:hypothetical protein